MTQIKPRKVLEKIKPYSPGKPIWELQEELKLDKVVKLASNENPQGPSPKGVAAISAGLADLHRYPDADTVSLKEAISKKLTVEKDQVIVTNGADELITLISEAFLDQGDEIIVPSPSFSEYDFGADLMGATVVPVPFDEGFQFNVERMIDAITDKTKLLYICSPNNPTGTYLAKAEFEKLLKAVPDHVLVVFDGAYSHYATAEDYTDGIEFVKAGYPILVLQTFSKVYGLAGLRVGFGVAPREVTQTILKVKEPFNVNSLAQAAAIAAINDDKHVEVSKESNATGAQTLYKEFSELGLSYVETMSNFVLVQLGPDAENIYQSLLEKGVIVRYGKIWGLPEYVRVTIGTEEENTFFIEKLKEVLNK
ncbi:histidinol-phosphate transaminase [Oceanobacillus piezotolerans]|uniref:Histidinol-phosphate aminotransferase n=1 Tax=Oceanobacillus piezotolerans TaxID=2448030 RepID=A0A498D7G3_9BACI|nr:histidinol-phosphate transaminase [Oceanobacillus piezotolerans]RLL41994.1 histidinol-phosphate transaminase [Oceanobacillus piezotolerans]